MEEVDWEKARKIFANSIENNSKALQKERLFLLAMGIFIPASLLMPGLGRIVLPKIRGRVYKPHRLRQTLQRLRQQKAVEIAETADGKK